MSTTSSARQHTATAQLLEKLAFPLLLLIMLAVSDLFIQFGVASLVWALVYASILVYLIYDHERYLFQLHRYLPILLFPCFALLSTYWSDAPQQTLIASIQLIFTTAIGIWIGSRFSRKDIFIALALATGSGLLLSLLSLWTGMIPHAGSAITHEGFSGVFAQKNVLGRNIALLALATVIISLAKNNRLPGLAALAVLGIPILQTASISSVSIYAAVWLIPGVWWALNRPAGLGYLTLALLGIALLGSFVIFATGANPIEHYLALAGKDSTLTGRTYLWAIGAELFSQSPLIGIGFSSFWDTGLYAQVATIRAHFEGQAIAGFHNIIIESLVALGLLGTLLFLTGYFSALWRNLSDLAEQKTVFTLGGLAFLVLAGTTALVDVVLFRQHEIFYLLMVCFYSVTVSEQKTST